MKRLASARVISSSESESIEVLATCSQRVKNVKQAASNRWLAASI
jgi:hypothetical protein